MCIIDDIALPVKNHIIFISSATSSINNAYTVFLLYFAINSNERPDRQRLSKHIYFYIKIQSQSQFQYFNCPTTNVHSALFHFYILFVFAIIISFIYLTSNSCCKIAVQSYLFCRYSYINKLYIHDLSSGLKHKARNIPGCIFDRIKNPVPFPSACSFIYRPFSE